MQMYIHIASLVLTLFIFCTRKLNHKSSTILIILFSISTFQIITHFRTIVKKDQPENTPQSSSKSYKKYEETEKPPLKWDFNERYEYNYERGLRISPSAWEFYEKYYDEKKSRTPSSPWDFDENDQEEIKQQFVVWTAWFEMFLPNKRHYLGHMLQLIEDEDMTVPLFCIYVAELYVITDKLMERIEQLVLGNGSRYSSAEPNELNQFLDHPKYIKTCKIMQKTEGKLSFKLDGVEEKEILILYDDDEGAKFVCKELLKFKNLM
ncbi:uncharacterized protein LOC135835212 [Planococcus citri]|uniref:uncharacterized protein LOC135835212 n=1 Tax=Planococcus citri TaxID=170843 RepID=UPI0031F92DB0